MSGELTDSFPWLLDDPVGWTEEQNAAAEFIYLKLCHDLQELDIDVQPESFISVGAVGLPSATVARPGDGYTILQLAAWLTTVRENRAAAAAEQSVTVQQARRQTERDARRAAIPYRANAPTDYAVGDPA